MYAYIKGTVAALGEDSCIIDNQGIGYRIYLAGRVLGELSVGDEQKLYTYFSVREDAMQLYGFLTQDELDLFRMLLGVSGVGPKGALAVLSVMNADDLRFAILSDDSAAIAKAPGIGLKTAKKVILDLKDKLDLEDAFEKKAENTAAASLTPGLKDSAQSEAVLALNALGYGSTEAMKAVRKAAAENEQADTETLIKAALKTLY